MKLALSTKRLYLTISLPLNKDDRIQQDFSIFKKANSNLFNRNNINIFDLKNPRWQEIENLGRTLPGAEDSGLSEIEMFQSRGKGSLLLNPEGLWFVVNVTKYEAHTPEIYTPVTPENVGLIERKMKFLNQNIDTDFAQAKRYKKLSDATLEKFPPRVS